MIDLIANTTFWDAAMRIRYQPGQRFRATGAHGDELVRLGVASFAPARNPPGALARAAKELRNLGNTEHARDAERRKVAAMLITAGWWQAAELVYPGSAHVPTAVQP